MKLRNPLEVDIYNIVKDDISKSKKPYSTITNNQISKELNISAFTIRDKVQKMTKQKVFQTVCNFWDENKQYHSRVIYLGNDVEC